MKKIAIKKAETEGVEYYILYPENAVESKNSSKMSDRNNPDSKLKKQTVKGFHSANKLKHLSNSEKFFNNRKP